MTNVILHGGLAKAAGRATWRFAIKQPREAIKAIDVNTKGALGRYLRAHETAEFVVIVDGVKLTPSQSAKPGELAIPEGFFLTGEFQNIEIMPVASGGDGVSIIEAILGVILIIVGIILIESPVGVPLIVMGAGMLVGAALSLLSPSPKLGTGNLNRAFARPSTTLGQKDEDDPRNNPSYLFNGASNTTTEGGAVPIIYGISVTGSRLVSMALLPGSIGEQQIGEARPPRPTDPFFDLPVWARIAAHPIGGIMKTPGWIRQMRPADRQDLWIACDLPEQFPAGCPVYGRRTPPPFKNVPPQQKLRYLICLCQFFNQPIRGLTKRELLDLYCLLNLHSIDNTRHASWEQFAEAIALHYSPEP